MDYIKQIQETIDYIDEHITEKLYVGQLAQVACFSTYHYYRVFYSIIGITVMEYVTGRKLQFALTFLPSGKREGFRMENARLSFMRSLIRQNTESIVSASILIWRRMSFLISLVWV